MTAISDARFWDKAAKKYAASAVADPDGYERTLASTLGLLLPDHDVLELGCGTGTTALRLAGATRSYVATDISAKMIAIANDKLAKTPLANLTFRQAVAEDFLSQDQRFDVVVGFNYLHLTRDPASTVHIIARLLKPGGVFISKTPCVGEMNGLIKYIVLPLMGLFGKAPHVSTFSSKELDELLAGNNFQIVAHENHASKGGNARPFIAAIRP